MKIFIDNELFLEISEQDLRVIENGTNVFDFLNDVKRRILEVFNQKFNSRIVDLKKDWAPILTERNIPIPEDDRQFAELVFSQPDYENHPYKLAKYFKEKSEASLKAIDQNILEYHAELERAKQAKEREEIFIPVDLNKKIGGKLTGVVTTWDEWIEILTNLLNGFQQSKLSAQQNLNEAEQRLAATPRVR